MVCEAVIVGEGVKFYSRKRDNLGLVTGSGVCYVLRPVLHLSQYRRLWVMKDRVANRVSHKILFNLPLYIIL